MIAAANALSDIYAMGATPITALNIVGFPQNGPPGMDVLSQILKGGHAKATEAGLSIIGGHTVDDNEPKYGLAVTGIVHPDQLITNKGAKAGDLLVLTKPLGTGILATALKADLAPPGTEKLLIQTCAHLNEAAAKAAIKIGVNAMTDITGFGLALHGADLAKHANAGIEILIDQLPILPGTRECMEMGLIPAGCYANRAHAYTKGLEVNADVPENLELLANDPQTSGGLLIAVNPKKADKLINALLTTGALTATIIGRITEKKGIFLGGSAP